MESFREYLGKTVNLVTKNCEPGCSFVGTFYTMDLARGIYVLRNVSKVTPTATEKYKGEYVGFKFGDVTSFKLDLLATLQTPTKVTESEPQPAAEKPAESTKPEVTEQPAPAAEEPSAKEEPATKDSPAAAPEENEEKPKHKLSIQRRAPDAEDESKTTTPATDANASSERGRGNRGGFRGGRGGHRKPRAPALQTPESLEDIKKEEYDFAGASLAFEKNYEKENPEGEEAEQGAYAKDDFFDSLTSETQESHRGRGHWRGRGGRGRGGRGGRGGYYNRDGYGRNYGRGGYHNRDGNGRGGRDGQGPKN